MMYNFQTCGVGMSRYMLMTDLTPVAGSPVPRQRFSTAMRASGRPRKEATDKPSCA
ncbi:hypothetical protein SXCC_02506 [Gluconacetobacter sp. SXCC-1]|uniref:hypothetical protein n=1 Tax=Komagataeibacter rhaeticus TaxID=215221 RepID=UPI0002080518|nr:hypothetical protein [Komagataeibacter rhaeticus]EGG77294.1 hypothetical protein SXCC_02506 [Gluconacetobacter sp. SXCC-1]